MGCNCKNCKDVTLFKGSDGVGIQHIEFNGCCNDCDNTFTIFLTDGTTYTSPNLTCNSCPVYANIILNEDNTLTAQVSGGTAPYTYEWIIADNGQFIGFEGSTNTDTVTVINIPSTPPDFSTGLVKVIVTDSNGCKVNDTYFYTVTIP